MNIKHFEGLVAATFTPFNTDGTLNLGIVPKYAERLKEDGIKGVFVCGSSGEGLLMETEERKRVAEAWMPYQENGFKIIVHVGSTSVKISQMLSEHAESIGADSIGCMGPCCFQPKDVPGLTAFCSKVAASAPNTPFYYYHIPTTSGVNVNMKNFLDYAGRKIPNLVGIKYTNSNMMDMLECMNVENGKYDILHGHDETFLAGMSFGAKAAIGTTFNFMALAFIELMTKFKQKKLEEALQIQTNINEVISVMLSCGSPISGGKALMKMSGIDCGPCLLPLTNINEQQIKTMEKELSNNAYYNLIKRW